MTGGDGNRLSLKSRAGKVSKQRVIFFLSICVYKLIIEFVYLNRISPLFSYSLLTTNIDLSKMIYSWAICTLICIVHPTDPNRPSTYLFLLMTLIMWIPLSSYYWMNNQNSAYMSCELLCVLVIALWCRANRKRFFMEKSVSHSVFDFLFVIYVLITIYLIAKRGGIDSRALDFKNVYQIRSEYDNLGSIDGYLVNWSAKAFFPVMSSYMFIRKKKIPLVMTFLLQIGLYSAYAYKAFLASAVLLLLLFILIQKKNNIKRIVSAFNIGNIAAYVLDILGITEALRAFLPYRTLFIPAKNQFHYYEYFSSHAFLQLSGSTFGRLLFSEYQYDRPIGYIVEAYFINSGSNGNTGVFSYGFADFGFAGMLAVALIVGFLFWFIDSTTYNMPVFLTVGALSYWVVTMNDNSLLITLVTGGFLILLIMLMLLNTCDLVQDNEKNNAYERSK